MKKIFSAILFASTLFVNAQVTVENGPELENDRDNKMNRMLGGDDKSYYCYRVRWRGRGTSYFIEKYDKATMKPLFSKEVNLPEERKTTIEDVEYSNNNVFIFRRDYDKKGDKMTLTYQTVSSSGQVSPTPKEITVIQTESKYNTDFEISANRNSTKFLIKSCYYMKDEPKTDFILMDAATQKILWVKTLNQNLFPNWLANNSGSIGISSPFGGLFSGLMENAFQAGFTGLFLDDNDDIYYSFTEKIVTEDKQKRFILKLSSLKAGEKTAKTIDLKFDDDYYVKDLQFMKNNNNQIVLGGFLKDVIERKGRDLVKVGIFSFTVDLKTFTVSAKATNFFDAKMLTALESSVKRSRYFKYKIDYIIPHGNDTYFVGEQYKEEYVTQYTGGNGMGGGSSRSYWHYEYMDVIVAKLNALGEFEWIKNTPLRIEMKLDAGRGHVFKQYIAHATDKGIYILCDDHPKNMARYEKPDYEPSDLKSMHTIHGSNFVWNLVSWGDGKITRNLIFENEKYCFAPIQEKNPEFWPPSECEIFVPHTKNEIFIYTEDRGRDRFSKLKLE
ncbi:MAG: hypothetical protein ACXVPN_01375 [Bacteroidia bacterium]